MPKMGESIAEATIIRWLKNVGERIEKDEPIVEIATDKVDSEIPSTEAGILTQQLHGDGAVVKVGEPVAMIDSKVNRPLHLHLPRLPQPSLNPLFKLLQLP